MIQSLLRAMDEAAPNGANDVDDDHDAAILHKTSKLAPEPESLWLHNH